MSPSVLRDLLSVPKVPVALVMFNRPSCTRQVFDRIAEYQPEKLLLIADGPRSDDEYEACRQTRAVADHVDWECEVLTNFSEQNLGMKRREISGFTWVFEVCEEAIILEDDTLPSRSFFPYCAELLQRFRDYDRVMMISGDNYCLDGTGVRNSYFCSKHSGTWGWATWRRAWRKYDERMTLWPSVRDTDWLDEAIGAVTSVEEWRARFDRTYLGRVSTWDYQWVFSMWYNEAFSMSPARNLVRNIGFGKGATHTGFKRPMSRFPANELGFPLRHPAAITWSPDIDRKMFDGERCLMREPIARRVMRRGLGLGLRSMMRRLAS